MLPDNQKIAQDIYIPGKDTMGAVTGHKVVVQITDYGNNGRKPVRQDYRDNWSH